MLIYKWETYQLKSIRIAMGKLHVRENIPAIHTNRDDNVPLKEADDMGKNAIADDVLIKAACRNYPRWQFQYFRSKSI